MLSTLKNIKKQLQNGNQKERLDALFELLQHGNEGLELFVEESLINSSEFVRQSSYWILHGFNPLLSDDNGLIRPTDTITSLAISSDYKLLPASSCQKIWIWDLETQKIRYQLMGHSHWVLSVVITPDGTKLISSSADKTIKIWNLKTGKLLYTLNGHTSWVNAVIVTTDGNKVISGSVDKTIKIWETETGLFQKTLTNKAMDIVLCLAISNDSKIIASGGTNKNINLWNIETGECCRTLEGHSDWIQSLSIDSKILISGARNGEIKRWTSETKQKPVTWLKMNIEWIAKGAWDVGSVFLLFGVNFFLGFFSLFISSFIKLMKDEANTVKFPVQGLNCSHTNKVSTNSINFVQINSPKSMIMVGGDSSKVSLLNTTLTNIKYFYQELAKSNFISSAIFIPKENSFIAAGNDWLSVFNIETGNLLYSFAGCSYPRINEICITNAPTSILLGQSYQFQVKATDANGNNFNLMNKKVIWTASNGTISNTGFYTPDYREERVTISVECESFQDSISLLLIEPPRVKKIIIEPSSDFSIYLGQSRKFSGKIYDQRNNLMPQEKVYWMFEGKGQLTELAGNQVEFKTGNVPGKAKITASANFIDSAPVFITVLENPKLTQLNFAQTPKTLKTNQDFKFEVYGLDQYGNKIDVKQLNFSASHGKINKTGYFEGYDKNQKVTITVTEKQTGISNKIYVDVAEPPKLSRLVIIPGEVMLEPGQEQCYTVQGFDQYNKSFSVTTSELSWSVTPQSAGCIDQGIYIADDKHKGVCQIKVTFGGISATANVFITTVLAKLEILPSQFELYPEVAQQFTLQGFDQKNQLLTLNKIEWKVRGSGKITRNGLFTSNYGKDKTVNIIASAEFINENNQVFEKDVIATITILPVLRQLTIFPSLAYVEPGSEQQFTVKGFDQFEEEIDIDPCEVEWSSSQGTIHDGLLSVDEETQGYCQVVVTSKFANKYTKKMRNILFSIGIGSRVLSWLVAAKLVIAFQNLFLESTDKIQEILSPQISLDSAEVDIEISQNNTEQSSEELGLSEETIAITNVESSPTEIGIFDFYKALQGWGFNFLYGLMYRSLEKISNFCIDESFAKLSASADVFVLKADNNIYKYFECLATFDYMEGLDDYAHLELDYWWYGNNIAITSDNKKIILAYSFSSNRSKNNPNFWTTIIKTWSLETQELLDTFIINQERINTIAITHDNLTLIGGRRWYWSSNRKNRLLPLIKAWDLKTKNLVYSCEFFPNLTGVRSIFVTQNDKKIIVDGYYKNHTLVLDFPSFNILHELKNGYDGYWHYWENNHSKEIPNSNRLIISGQIYKIGHTLKIYNMESKQEKVFMIFPKTGKICSTAISSNGKLLISLSMDTKINEKVVFYLHFWDLTNLDEKHTKKRLLHVIEFQSNSYHILEITPDNNTFITVTYNNIIQFWSLKNYKLIHELETKTNNLRGLKITPNGKQLISYHVGSQYDNDKSYETITINLWGIPDYLSL